MTENEAKKMITKFCEARMNFARGKDMSDKELEDFCKFSEALNLSISSLEEIQQYRAIGTFEECREARERQRARKPLEYETHEDYDDGICPNCKAPVNDVFGYCTDCGQSLLWECDDE